jgi:hypothetical protein
LFREQNLGEEIVQEQIIELPLDDLHKKKSGGNKAVGIIKFS